MDLSNSRAIVTGGASGLGAATAAHFRKMGAQVTLLDLDHAGEAAATAMGASAPSWSPRRRRRRNDGEGMMNSGVASLGTAPFARDARYGR